MKKVFLISLSVLILILACTTKDGIDPGLVDKGYVIVKTNTDTLHAKIFIDATATGSRTPDTLELVTGEHTITLHLAGYKTIPDSHVVIVKTGETDTANFVMEAVNTGTLVINSTPDYADVKVNGIRFGYTPITIDSLAVGSYNVEISKFGHTVFSQDYIVGIDTLIQINEDLTRSFEGRTLVVEHFSNTNCDPCVDMEETYESMMEQNDSIEIISIGYHPPFPSANDPMYLAAQEENDARKDHYNITATPIFHIDGSFLFAFDTLLLRSMLNAKIIERSAITDIYANIDIGIESSFGQMKGNVRINAVQDLPANSKLRIVLIEKDVHIDSPGTNGMTEFKDIMRDMYPDAGGTGLTLAVNESLTIPFEMDIQANWTGGVRVVAFIQIDDNGEIIQAAQSLVY